MKGEVSIYLHVEKDVLVLVQDGGGGGGGGGGVYLPTFIFFSTMSLFLPNTDGEVSIYLPSSS